MAKNRVYGAPKDDGKPRGNKYGDRRITPEPKPKQADPSPPADVVRQFHENSDLDRSAEAQHHTLGVSPYNASSGSHQHKGGDSVPLFEGATLTGSKGGNVALSNLITILAQYGLTDNTT